MDEVEATAGTRRAVAVWFTEGAAVLLLGMAAAAAAAAATAAACVVDATARD